MLHFHCYWLRSKANFVYILIEGGREVITCKRISLSEGYKKEDELWLFPCHRENSETKL